MSSSLAQVFDEFGHGIILRGTPVSIDKKNRHPYLSDDQAYELLRDALEEYDRALEHMPARIVIHKSSHFRNGERKGFLRALAEKGIRSKDFVTITDTDVRLFSDNEYARPPAEHQFKPGQSGNRNGRPRKPTVNADRSSLWGTSTLAAGRVLYEEVTVTQNGKTKKMQMIEAVHRRRAADALKGGNRLLQREVIAEANAHEQKMLEAEVQHYRDMCERQAEGERMIAQARSRNLPEPELLPHPGDIVLDHNEMTAWVDGPETLEQLQLHKFLRQVRDHLVLRSVYQQRFPSLLHPVDPDGHKWLQPMAELFNNSLCPRMRWGQSGFWRSTQPLLRRGFRFIEADMQDGLWSLSEVWKREPALASLRKNKLVNRLMTSLIEFKTRSHERRIWQRQHDSLLAVFREIYGAEKVAHLSKRASLKPYAERKADLETMPADQREQTTRRARMLINAGYGLPSS